MSTVDSSPGAEAGRPLGTVVWPRSPQVSGCLSLPDFVLCGGRRGSVCLWPPCVMPWRAGLCVSFRTSAAAWHGGPQVTT